MLRIPIVVISVSVRLSVKVIIYFIKCLTPNTFHENFLAEKHLYLNMFQPAFESLGPLKKAFFPSFPRKWESITT